MRTRHRLVVLLSLLPLACGDDRGGDSGAFSESETGLADAGEDDQGETDSGDGDPGDGDGEPGDGDGEPGDGDGEAGDGDGEAGDGDGEAGDGDGEAGDGDGDPDELCPLALALVPCDGADDDPLHALGLDCPGDPPQSIPLSAVTFTANDGNSWKVAKQFGSSGDWSPHEGEKVLIISTGTLTNPNNDGAVVLPAEDAQIGTDNGNPDNVNNLPNPIEPKDGSGGTPFEDCDGQNDCSDTLEAQWELGEGRANDLLWFRFDLAVPEEANGYKFDFAFFSAEFPEWVDTQYNDIFLVWSTSETYTGNVTFINGQPLTVTALEDSVLYEGNDPQLAGTGVDGVGGGPMGQGMMEPVGGATGWFTATGSAAPGETFTLAWALFDMGDSFYDTTVVLDAFRWSCEGCVPSEHDSCGIQPQ
ncbi:MAG: choice-of-anchor L domain-containing protein [Enhygromyxa sp.]